MSTNPTKKRPVSPRKRLLRERQQVRWTLRSPFSERMPTIAVSPKFVQGVVEALAQLQLSGIDEAGRKLAIEIEQIGRLGRERFHLHQLISNLPDNELETVRQFLENRTDPVLRALMDAPQDDEPETDEERAAIAEARLDISHGDVILWERYLAERAAR